MNSRVTSLGNTIAAFMIARGVPGEMEQNLIKEAIHLHLLSALSDAGVLRHVVFQGGTALRLCYGGERYSEDLDFVSGPSGVPLGTAAFDDLIRSALEATSRSLEREFGIGPDHIVRKSPARREASHANPATVATWQIIVPIGPTARSPKSRVKLELANVPAYTREPRVARVAPGLVQVPDVILAVESASEILADKAVALAARAVLKHRDIWDVWDLTNRIEAKVDREMVGRKFADYGVTDVKRKAGQRLTELSKALTATAFLKEMKRFLPARRVAQMTEAGLHHAILAESGALLEDAVFGRTR